MPFLEPAFPKEPRLVFPPDPARANHNERRLHSILSTLDALVREPSSAEEKWISEAALGVLRPLAADYVNHKQRLKMAKLLEEKRKLESQLAHTLEQLRAETSTKTGQGEQDDTDGVPPAWIRHEFPLASHWADLDCGICIRRDHGK